jgi:tetratricopeptide (TPR) repeat protein
LKLKNSCPKGFSYYSEKKYSEAIKEFTSAISIDNNNAEIYYYRGLAYYHLNDTKNAIYDFETALKHEPENPFRYSSLAYIKAGKGQITEAIELYKQAIALDPEDAIAHNNLGLLEEQAGYKDSAKERFIKADNLSQNLKLFEPVSMPRHPSKKEGNSGSLLNIISGTFSNKKIFKEWLSFIKNGFKIK